MDLSNNTCSLLELIEQPAFCVQGYTVIFANRGARQRQVEVGSKIEQYLPQEDQSYADFHGNELGLTLKISDVSYHATVRRMDGFDLFLLEPQTSPELQSMALAAQHLRIPLANVMATAEQLFSEAKLPLNEENYLHINRMQKGLYQLHRIIGNMSDACQYQTPGNIRLETVEISSVFREIIDKATSLLSGTGIILEYTDLDHMLFCKANRDMIERAVYNLISNAIKFSAGCSKLKAKLTQNESSLSFSLQNTRDGMSDAANSFNRFIREPGIDDGSIGIGLGMTLVRSIAAAHNGTVLIDYPDQNTTRVTFTISILPSDGNTVSSPILYIGDYAGGRDHGLLELSEVISPAKFQIVTEDDPRPPV